MPTFTLASFNICSAHFKEGHYTEKNLAALAEEIAKSGADVACLQEVDRGAARSRGVDMPAYLAAHTQLAHHYFIKIRNFEGGEYGTAILSRYPITESQTVNYAVRIATQGTSCGFVTLDVEGVPVTVFNTHLSVESEEANTETLCCLADVLADYRRDHPAGFLCCGDFNTTPDKVARFIPWVSLAHKGLITFGHGDKAKSIDHILYTGSAKVSNTRTLHTMLHRVTDHNMVLTAVTVG